MTLNDYLPFLTRSISLILIFGVGICWQGYSQSHKNSYQNFVPVNYSIKQDTNSINNYPDPKKVLHRSLMIPGWGQVTNKQAWKVPIIYGLIGGLTYYSITLHKNYNDYRAAYYNLHPDTPDDFKFGPTPDFIPPTADLNSLRNNRNFYRNRRDFVYISIALSYALNVIDAYVFAHLRSFDVSDDLSMNSGFKPGMINGVFLEPIPSLTLSLKF